MVRYPAGEHITVPRHVDTRTVRTMLNASMVMPHPKLAAAAPLTMPVAQLAARAPRRGRLIEAGIARLPEGPNETKRRARALLRSSARRPRAAERRRGTITGRDVYGLTARTHGRRGARSARRPGYDRSGALAPSEAFDPDRVPGRASADFGVDHEVMPA